MIQLFAILITLITHYNAEFLNVQNQDVVSQEIP